MPSKKRKFGDLGEKIAEQYLIKNGYFILEKNFQTKMGELDIIAFKPRNKISRNVNEEIGKFFTNNKEIGKNNRENLINKEVIRKDGLVVFVEVKSSLISNDQNVSRETPPFLQKGRGETFDNKSSYLPCDDQTSQKESKSFFHPHLKVAGYSGRWEDKIRPEENVHFKKQRHLIKSAQNYLAYKQFPLDINWQIDVIAIDIDKIFHKANLRHIKQAVTL